MILPNEAYIWPAYWSLPWWAWREPIGGWQ